MELSLKEINDMITGAFKSADFVHEKLQSFLQKDQLVKISNTEYMDCYSKWFKAAEASQNPMLGDTGNKINGEELLFKWFQTNMENYLKNDIIKLQTKIDDELFITEVQNQYQNFQIYLHWMWKFCNYLDRFYLKNKNTSLYTQGYIQYREKYFDQIKVKLLQKIVYFLNNQRDDKYVPKQIIKRILGIYTDLGFEKKIELKKDVNTGFNAIPEGQDKYYKENFEQLYQKEIENYFTKMRSEWQNFSTPEYVQEALKALDKEEEMAEYYYKKSRKVIITAIEVIIIEQQAEVLVNNESTGVGQMLEASKEQQLKDIYKLFKRVRKTLEHLAKKLTNYLDQKGQGYNNESENKKKDNIAPKDIAQEYVQNVFTLKKEADNLVVIIFQNDLELQKARDKAFQQFLNKIDKPTFYLAMHCDLLLKQEGFTVDQEVEEKLTEIVRIFVYFYARDAFFKHYQKFFCNRLLNATSKNKEAEKSLISKFKAEAGQTAINKIETMLNDIKNSDEFMQETKKLIPDNIEMNIQVLTNGSWPLTNNEDKCQIPDILEPNIKKFDSVYCKKYPGRSLTWMFSQGTSEIIFKANPKDLKEKYTLQATSYQMIQLLLLDKQSNGRIDYGKFLQISGIKQEEFDLHLMALIKAKILVKKNENDKFEDYEYIEINNAFQNKLKKIKCIPGGKAVQNKVAQDEKDKSNSFQEDLIKERECIVDACIVRIMKGRRVMKHNDLLPDVLKLVHIFKPDVNLIKRRIESLIERDYLKRDDKDRNTFHYVP